MTNSIIKRFFSGDLRSVMVKKNIVFSLLIKGLSIAISMILIPLTLGYLNQYEYGIWLTISSVLVWLEFFDLGLGNGLRNKLSVSLANGDKNLSKIYVSTTFYSLLLIISSLLIVFFLVERHIDWYSALNIQPDKIENLNTIIATSFVCVCVSFLFKIVQTVFFALQKPMFNSLILLVGQLLALAIIYILSIYTEGSLFYVALVLSASPAIALIVAYPILFHGKHSDLRPSIKKVEFKHFNDLFGLGVKFLLLQIGGLLIFSTSNIIISKSVNPAEVTPYNIAFKYFNIVIMIFSIILTPMWSAVTEAYAKSDLKWIRNCMNKALRVYLLSIPAIILMTIFSGYIYKIWIGDSVQIPFILSLLSAVYVIITNLSTCYSTFIFGTGKLHIQMISTVFSGVLFVLLATFLANRIGVSGVLFALCIANVPGLILNVIQYRKIVTHKCSGIWDK